MIKLSGIKKSYNGRLVLDLPDLSFSQGERCALIGANGSGKSTLLRLLAGILTPDEGQVAFSGLSAGLGYMPQKPYAFDRTVLKNVCLGLPATDEGQTAALRAIDRVGLSGLSGARGSRLSGGEAQRMAFARMIAQPRSLLLLDEPTAATDVDGTLQLESALADYLDETACAVIFATHSFAQARRCADRIVMLDGGRICEDGPAEQVLNTPQSEPGQKLLRCFSISG